MKKAVSLLLASAMATSLLAGCGGQEAGGETPDEVALSVTTTYAGNDGNAQNYADAVAAFTAETGIVVNDSSATSDEAFKARIQTDFQAGSEPDVLFFFTGADANEFIAEGKVVSLDTIRETYPEYASNMKDDLLPKSLVDGKNYTVPVNGIWEAMFVNTAVLEAAGVAVPGADYTWDMFLADCQTIKDAGYTPIAAALGHVPHYWWEYSIFNNTTMGTHREVPADITSGNGPAWVQGMNDVKELYDLGYFPENTLSAQDDETVAMFLDDKAAFLIDGSWKVGGITSACQADENDPSTLDTEKLAKFDVTYVPGKDQRKATDIIADLSMGYYITTKAWENEATRDAAVKFVEYMTTDAQVSKFAAHSTTALKNAPEVDSEQLTSLQIKAIEMVAGSTYAQPAVQDIFPNEARVSTFDGMPSIVTGEVTAEDAVTEGLQIYAEMNAE